MTTGPARILWGKLTLLSLGALALALLLGIVAGGMGPAVPSLARVVEPVGSAWILALRLVVVPLVVFQLAAAVVGQAGSGTVGRLGLRTLGAIVALLAVTGVTSVTVMGPVVRLVDVDETTAQALKRSVSVPQEALGTTMPSVGDWVSGMARLDVVARALSGQILPLLLVALLAGLIVSRLPQRLRDPSSRAIRAAAAFTMRLVTWILWVTPLAVFSLVLRLALDMGIETLGLLWFYVAIVCAWMLTVSLLLYPAAATLGNTTLPTFARAVAPAQMVAVSTRSSLMSLPALVEGGREHLRLGDGATGFVLPLCSSIFKMSTVTAEPVRYLFLAYLFDVPLTLETAFVFLATIWILSFVGVGIPGGGSGFDTLPAFAAVGIPIEGLVLVVAVDTIPDIAKTLINVTGHMTVATIVTRGDRASR